MTPGRMPPPFPTGEHLSLALFLSMFCPYFLYFYFFFILKKASKVAKGKKRGFLMLLPHVKSRYFRANIKIDWVCTGVLPHITS